MSKLKIIALIALTAGSSIVAIAGNIPSCATPVTIPCANNSWHVGASALYYSLTLAAMVWVIVRLVTTVQIFLITALK